MTGVIAVEELRRAHAAVRAGAFRAGRYSARSGSELASGAADWTPRAGEQVVLVAPCAPGAGASTVALVVASAAGRARVVECSTGSASTLAAASDAELGRAMDGWMEGARGEVLLQRRSDRIAGPSGVPAPPGSELPLTVLDSSWDVEDLLHSPGWLGDLARALCTLVLVTRPTIPGLRRAENALSLVGVERGHLVLVGMRSRGWPRQLAQSAGPLVRRLRAADQITCLRFHAGLAMTGPTPDPLPAGIVRAARPLLAALEGAL